MTQVLIESPQEKKKSKILISEYNPIKSPKIKPVSYTNFKEIKQKRKFRFPTKSLSKIKEQAKYNGKVFEELISVKEIRRNIHFRNYNVY